MQLYVFNTRLFCFVLISLKVIFYKSNIKHNSPGSAALLIIEMMPTIFKTKVNPQGAVKWFHRKQYFFKSIKGVEGAGLQRV